MDKKDWKNQLTQILERLSLLDEKYAGMGQDMLSYLDGLYYSNGLSYWEYIHLDSLLGLQTPRTPFNDEVIFITYHQITELMFKLIKQEIHLLTAEDGQSSEYLNPANWVKRVTRINNYFKHLCNSFDIMLSGMDKEELRKFRMALLPASGFQSVQFREIEIMSTSLENLVRREGVISAQTTKFDLYYDIYWKKGGIDLETQKKTITLKEFEKKYDERLLYLINKFENYNLHTLFMSLPPEIREDAEAVKTLREYDQYVNIYWKLSHLSAASKHLVIGEQTTEATGGTNWRTFLPPKFQKIIFFPELWSGEEIESWGKAGVMKYFREHITTGWLKQD